uniref:Uncharacterized protein n=1 Tax=Kwoniella pini CBS 10737 TaxID=1296096 RepID=A0A1B9HZB5_9TREE|nr:uncharacterized protein I206_05396 [Kwoniella pini CBS 10737]OCF48616.1 hypothetical protein I206_05396 [Kwoniella pini CBS 10737]
MASTYSTSLDLAPIITSFPSSSGANRYSSSSTTSHASSSSWTPSRDSVCSNASEWSATLITPRAEKTFSIGVVSDEIHEDEEDKIEYIDLSGKESWWNDRKDDNEKVLDQWLDDSPTLPCSGKISETSTMPSLSLRKPLSSKRLGKMPARPGTPIRDSLGQGERKSGRNIFDVFDIEVNDQQNHDVFDSVSIRRPFTKHRTPIPVFPTAPIGPKIPSRASSRRPPALPSRDSSLKSLSAHLKSESQILIPSRPTHPHRPIPIRTFSHPPSCSSKRSSLKSHRRVSPILLQAISETPKDLDVSPDGSWALRQSLPKLGLAKSQPNLRSRNPDMTLKFKLKRSNSSNSNQDSTSDFMSLDAFPSSRKSFDVSDRTRESRASFSDMARTFLPRGALPESPSRMSLDGRPTITTNFGNLNKKSVKSSSNLLSGLKRSQSVRRPSLLGLPEWSPNSTTSSRSISDSYVVQLSPNSSKTLETLSISYGRDSPASSTHSGNTREEVLRVKYNNSRHSIASSISSKFNSFIEEDLLAVLDAEHWDWPSPPFRIERTESTPGLSTSGTLESMISPQTPSESEFVLHGEVEYLARAAKENKKNEDNGKAGRQMKWSNSIESLNIHL